VTGRKTRPNDPMSSAAPANAGQTQGAGRDAGGRYREGVSGNPKGMRPGTRHRNSQLDEMLSSAAPDVIAKVIELALVGEPAACRLVVERVLPVRKGAPVQFDLPPVSKAADVVAAVGAVITEVARGELSPEEGSLVANLLEAKRKAIEVVDLESRVAELERKVTS
jgi:hypothetical protein